MDAYEKAIADALNDIADKEIYFHPSEIMSLSDTLAYKVIGTLHGYYFLTNLNTLALSSEERSLMYSRYISLM